MCKSTEIGIWFNQRDFEYDVHSLVMAFYPGKQISLCYGEDFFVTDYSTAVKLEYSLDKIRLSLFEDGQFCCEEETAQCLADTE